jgi:rhamnosyltransferase
MNAGRLDPIGPTQKSVCAIAVTYFPDEGVAQRIRIAKDQVAALVVVDNSCDSSIALQLEAIRGSGVHLIFNEGNAGLAAALNSGIAWARAAGFRWAWLLDQDTTVHRDAVEQLLSIVHDYPDRESIAAIGSNYEASASKQSPWSEVASVITSGTLLSIPAFDRVGPFRAEFFVDCVDLDYCLRARADGFRILRSSSKLMEHQIGNVTMHSILSFRAGTSNHAMIRRYYLARNLTTLMREYWRREPRWVARMIFNQVKSMVLMFLFEKDRRLKLKLFLIGLFDGLRGWFGRDLSEWKNGKLQFS